MSMLQWSFGTDLPSEDVELISDRVFEHGRSLAANGNATSLACLARSDGAVVAGASGRTEYGRLFVQNLWVHEALRGKGIGTEALRRMEQAAVDRNCESAVIETLNDRACSLYRRLGYEIIAQVPNYVGPFSRYILLKRLKSAA